jgi:ABC-type uncharacterized transport system substrate-binding protein
VNRRQFIGGLGLAAWPVVARGQQNGRMRQVGVLLNFDENDSEAQAHLSTFTQGLADSGWTDGRNIRMDVRWGAGNIDRMRMFAKELVDLQPDVILAEGTPTTAAAPAGDADGPDRICGRLRPGGRRLRGEPVAPGREPHTVSISD